MDRTDNRNSIISLIRRIGGLVITVDPLPRKSGPDLGRSYLGPSPRAHDQGEMLSATTSDTTGVLFALAVVDSAVMTALGAAGLG